MATQSGNSSTGESEQKSQAQTAQLAVENSSEVANSSTNASSTHSRQKRSLDSVGQDRDINGGLIDKGDLGKNVTSLNEPGDKHEATDYHYYTNYDNEPVFGDAGIARYAPGDAKGQTQAKGEDNAIICDMALVLLI